MKKLLVTLLIVAFAAGFVFTGIGCKEEAAETEEIAETEEAAEVEEAEEAEEEEVAEPVELLFWNFGVYGISYLERESEKSEWYISKAIKRFEEENPGITIELATQEGSNVIEMMSAAAMAGEGPDIVGMWGGNYVKTIKDSLLPLNDYFTPEEMSIVHDWENHTFDGNSYGAPIRTMIANIYYNKKIFEDVGIDVTQDYNGTYESLIEISEKIKNAEVTPLIHGVADGWGLSFLEGSLFVSQTLDPGTLIADIISGKKNFSETPEFITAFEAAQDLYTRGYYNEDVISINRAESLTIFANGGGAMFPSISFDFFDFKEGLGDDVGVMPMPSIELDSPNFGACVGGVGSDAIVATNFGEHPIEATDFIRFLRTYDEERIFVKETGEIPSVDGDYSDVLFDPVQEEFLKLGPVEMMLDNLMPGNVADTWFSLESVMLSGQITVEEFLAEMDLARDEALEAGE